MTTGIGISMHVAVCKRNNKKTGITTNFWKTCVHVCEYTYKNAPRNWFNLFWQQEKFKYL